jgi:hypothetical protein
VQKQAGFVEERRLDTVRTVHFGVRAHVFEVSWDFAASGRCRFVLVQLWRCVLQ